MNASVQLSDRCMANTAQTPGRPPGSVLPDSAWSWLVVCGNVVIGVTTLGFFRSIPVFFRSIMLEYDVEYAKASSVLGLGSFGMALGCFFLPFLTNKFGSQLTCFVAGFVMGISNTISSFSDSFVVLQICTGFLTGCCMGILVFTMISSSSRYFIKHRAKATGISTVGIPLGTLLLAPATDLLIQKYGWRGALLILSGIVMNSCVSASLYRPVVLPRHIPRKKSSIFRTSTSIGKLSMSGENKRSSIPADLVRNVDQSRNSAAAELLEEGGNGDYQNRRTSDISRWENFRTAIKKKVKAVIDYELFKSFSYDIGLLSSIFFYSGYVSTNTFLVPLARDYVGLESFEASTMLSISGFAEIIAKVITGFMADAKRINKYIFLALSCILSSFIIASMTLCQSYFSLAIVSFAYGLSVTAFVGIIAVIFCDIVGPHKIATAVGYQGCVYALFLAPCLYLMGLLVDSTGDVRWIFYACAVLLALAALCLLVIYGFQVRKRKLGAKMIELQTTTDLEG